MRNRVVVAGSLHQDIVVRAPRLPGLDETLPGQSVSYVLGGKGRNQAVSCARNGGRTMMVGRIGNDAAGHAFCEDFDRNGVDRSLLQLDGRNATGMSVAITTPAGEYGAVIVSGTNLYLDVADIEIPLDTAWLVLQNEIPEPVNLALARKARLAGAKILLNAAPARPLAAEFSGLIDLLVVNRLEGAEISGFSIESVRDALAAAEKLQAFADMVIVTLGAQGLVHKKGSGRAEAQPAFPAQTVSMHGAGDFFIGALVSQLAGGSDLDAAVRYAQAGAAIFVSTELDRKDQIRPVHIRALLGED